MYMGCCCSRWVVAQLEVDGEDVIGRVRGLDLLLAALVCIAEPLGYLTTSDTQQQQQRQGCVLDLQQLQELGLGSWCWWCMRAVMLQQHVLSGRSNTLHGSLKQLVQHTLSWADALPAAAAAAATAAGGSTGSSDGSSTGSSPEVQAQVLAAVAHLEVALIQQGLGKVTDSQQQLEAAAAALGVKVELTGALGVRTRHQIDPKAQLIAGISRPGQPAAAGSSGSSGSSMAAVAGLQGFDVAALGFEEVGLTKELEGMEDDSAVYLAPRLVNSTQPGSSGAAADANAAGGESSPAAATTASSTAATNGVAHTPTEQTNGAAGGHAQQPERLGPLVQALMLGWAAQIRKGTSQDELQLWQMAPFVEAVLQQQHTHYMLYATARLLKCR